MHTPARLAPLIILAAFASCTAVTDIAMPSRAIDAWGDSLTDGVGADSALSYPAQLARLLGRPVRNFGNPGETSTQIAARIVADSTHRGDVTIIWLGTNNSYSPDQILADADRAVAHLTTDHFLIAGPENRPKEYAGRAEYDLVTQSGRLLAAKYGDHVVDLRAFLVSQYDSTQAEDITDHALDIPPASLRSDDVHLNAIGYRRVAVYLDSILTARGW